MLQKQPKPFIKGFKFPIYPTSEQTEFLNKTFGCCRYVYNRGIKEAIAAHEHQQAELAKPFKDQILPIPKPLVSMNDLCKQLVIYKNDPENTWLSETSSVAHQQSMRHLADAFSKFFRTKKGYPKLKHKNRHKQSFTLTTSAFRLKSKHFYIALCKTPIKVHFTRELPSEPSSVTISRDATGQHYASFVCKYYPTKTAGKGKIGIDLGLIDYITTNTGLKVQAPKYLRKAHAKLRRLQQTLSRRKKGSANYEKARITLAVQHRRVANSRSIFQHQLSRKLVNENQVIALETLTIQHLVKNRRLSKSWSDAGISSFTSMLNYKAVESQHCQIVYVSKWYPSSHLCSSTDLKLDRKLKLSERKWLCPLCNHTHDRDTNAAKKHPYGRSKDTRAVSA